MIAKKIVKITRKKYHFLPGIFTIDFHQPIARAFCGYERNQMIMPSNKTEKNTSTLMFTNEIKRFL